MLYSYQSIIWLELFSLRIKEVLITYDLIESVFVMTIIRMANDSKKKEMNPITGQTPKIERPLLVLLVFIIDGFLRKQFRGATVHLTGAYHLKVNLAHHCHTFTSYLDLSTPERLTLNDQNIHIDKAFKNIEGQS
ncbi:hypothetical protein PHYBLDRAFT_58279 [Phycomyces blakesleeanus NRRL 1555(-)]|uniref:Uncharacterized protein n=1 Tax=Phycomyces blakesleeanus (strain ATCC 8743b / DSM 1359 / FGSC 10004 / NBRC 33097 / NRRL 1555) TaxID=763407 RepID=A0A163EL52_PHYB8|nr:hypothetical protein PHYBLDRAFT_58279 [Phycomyces blakesleeanus NRRL 1555(-)]OAD79230.1 hypothetical protein PHYBLDRAFT_58279 [Phycomyces blakesleeanus NRRL 1555(-)]|eukprot:XP_018297270.1 hypothetical protein PHYBLDRAFT_58279 [Phycomyces blakesleeanus NRRL 1555(-)]